MTQAVQLAQYGSTGVSQGFKNKIINGATVIFQRGTSTAVDSTYFVDRWYIAKVGSGTFTADASSTVPTGFYRSIMATVNTAEAAVASTDEFSIRQHIEGYNINDLAWGTADAKTITISFWVRSTVTGTYPVAVRSQSSDVTYVTTYTISAANTWEYKTATIPGPTTGTFGVSNDIGCTIIFGLGGGTSFQGTANTWNSGNKWFTSACTQWFTNASAVFNITGIQFEVGSSATSFEYRSYGQELVLCQRYYNRMVLQQFTGVNGFCDGSSEFISMVNFPVVMRDSPTFTSTGYGSALIIRKPGGVSNTTDLYQTYAGTQNCRLYATASSLTLGHGAALASGEGQTTFLAWAAEL
jgi:hypothetical protein